jgi:hypothetical protein
MVDNERKTGGADLGVVAHEIGTDQPEVQGADELGARAPGRHGDVGRLDEIEIVER